MLVTSTVVDDEIAVVSYRRMERRRGAAAAVQGGLALERGLQSPTPSLK